MGSAGRYIFREWRVLQKGVFRTGVCFKETLWGRGNVRWVWLRFPDGSEKAFAPSHLRASFSAEQARKAMESVRRGASTMKRRAAKRS